MNKIVRYSITAMVVMFLCGCGKVETIEDKTDEEIREDINEALTEMVSEATATEAPTEETEELPDDYLTKVVKNDSWDDFRYVKFGKWDMDQREDNGTEFIDWYILEKNDHDVLLISRQKLKFMKYNEGNGEEPVSWENCSMRSWLNGEFFDSAFSAQEQSMIEDTIHDDGTVDKAYMLSVDEFRRYCEAEDDGTGAFAFTAYYCHVEGFYFQKFADTSYALRQTEESTECPIVYDALSEVDNTGKYREVDELVKYRSIDYNLTVRAVIRVAFD